MDDEEEDMSRPVSQLWGTSFRDVKHQDRATQTAAGQALVTVTAAASASSQNLLYNNNNNSVSLHHVLPCRLPGQPRMLFHGNAGFRPHFPARFEPMGGDHQGERRAEEEWGGVEEEHGMEEGSREEEVAASVEAQIGRKLREIGDQFHQDHLEMLLRHQRDHLPIWMRLTVAVFGFLFPREAAAPRLRGEER